MFCSNCGSKVLKDENFCSNCGKKIVKINSEVGNKNTILLKCKNCGGELLVDKNKQVIMCPYCESKELIIESDSVKIAKITSQAYCDVEFGKQQTEIKIKQLDIKEKNKADSRFFISKIMGLLTLLGSIGIFVLCVEYQDLFDSGAKFFMTMFCLILLIIGICLLCRRKPDNL